MKTLKSIRLFALFIAMGFSTTLFAQVPETQDDNMGTQDPVEQQQQTLPEDEQDHIRVQENKALPQDQNQLTDVDYSLEIEEAELPASITSSLDEMYPEHEVKKIFRGSDNSYKIKIKDGNEKSVVYYDENGTFVKKEKDKDKKNKNRDW